MIGRNYELLWKSEWGKKDDSLIKIYVIGHFIFVSELWFNRKYSLKKIY